MNIIVSLLHKEIELSATFKIFLFSFYSALFVCFIADQGFITGLAVFSFSFLLTSLFKWMINYE